MNGDDAFARRPKAGAQIPEKIQKAFDDIAKYFSKKEWEKMKSSEKISYVYMKRKYEAMTKLGFKATLPPFMRNTGATDLQGNDFDNDRNHRNQEMSPILFICDLHIIKIMPKKPAENNGKQLCPPGKRTTSEKINKASGNREAQEKEERRGTAHRWSSQNTHNIGPKRGKHAWTHRLSERKQLVIYEEISDPEEDNE
uniref:KRAB-related domain-containing protein n=1 Tax=Pan troglodytes TaxID=9598 RepID=A0A2I3SUZ7_PANTR